jgi:hypothetical protein
MYSTNRKLRPADYDGGIELTDVMRFIRRFATVELEEDFTEVEDPFLTEKKKEEADVYDEEE